MKNNDLSSIFELGKNKSSFRLVETKGKNEVYVGYNDQNEPAIAIYGNEIIKAPVQSKSVNIVFSSATNNEKNILYFILIKTEFYDAFLKFCDFLIAEIGNENYETIINKSYKCWVHFRQTFEKKNDNFMTIESIKGLMGELLYLNDYMFKYYDVHTGLDSWRGCEKGHKDFEFENSWTEVKASDSHSSYITISSFEQLDSKLIGNLAVIKLDLSSSTMETSICLNELVSKISFKIIDVSYVELFYNKLKLLGYLPDEYYEQFKFSIKSKLLYKVTENFPKISLANVPQGILNARYDVDLNAINEFYDKEF